MPLPTRQYVIHESYFSHDCDTNHSIAVPLREIHELCELQRGKTGLIIDKLVFSRLVRHIATKCELGVRFSISALEALHETAEAMMIGYFQGKNKYFLGGASH